MYTPKYLYKNKCKLYEGQEYWSVEYVDCFYDADDWECGGQLIEAGRFHNLKYAEEFAESLKKSREYVWRDPDWASLGYYYMDRHVEVRRATYCEIFSDSEEKPSPVYWMYDEKWEKERSKDLNQS
jgi:hypothetical protein